MNMILFPMSDAAQCLSSINWININIWFSFLHKIWQECTRTVNHATHKQNVDRREAEKSIPPIKKIAVETKVNTVFGSELLNFNYNRRSCTFFDAKLFFEGVDARDKQERKSIRSLFESGRPKNMAWEWVWMVRERL